jgi:hypothetical protein
MLVAQEPGISVGTSAPPAVVETLDGGKADLGTYFREDARADRVLGDLLPNCKELEPAMLAAQKKYAGKRKFVCVAESVNQSPERVKLYAEKHGMPMDMYYDRKGYATDAYDVPATSYVVVVDKSGKIVYTGQGDDQDIESAIRKAVTS